MMRIDELIKEIEEIVNTASGVPLTGKVMVEGEEIINILNDIEACLPDEIKQARWIQSEKDRILSEAKKEYETVVNDAKRHAESLVEKNVILARAQKRADELMMVTEENVRRLKMSTYDYIDSVLYKFQEQMAQLNDMYAKMFDDLENTFNRVENMLNANRDEIKDMAYRTQMGHDGNGNSNHGEESFRYYS